MTINFRMCLCLWVGFCVPLCSNRWNCASNTNHRIATTTSDLCSAHLSPGNNIEAICDLFGRGLFHRHFIVVPFCCFHFILHFSHRLIGFVAKISVPHRFYEWAISANCVSCAQVSQYCLLLASAASDRCHSNTNQYRFEFENVERYIHQGHALLHGARNSSQLHAAIVDWIWVEANDDCSGFCCCDQYPHLNSVDHRDDQKYCHRWSHVLRHCCPNLKRSVFWLFLGFIFALLCFAYFVERVSFGGE